MDESQTNQKVIEEPNPQYMSATALELRLDTSPLLARIEMYLTGKSEVVEDGELVIRTVTSPIANELGVHRILGTVANIVNSVTVQGNFEKPDFEQYMYDVHVRVASHLIINRPRYDIPIEELRGIIGNIILLIKPFISRIIDNLERGSYPGTIMHVERGNQTLTQPKTGIKRFLGG